MKDYEHIFVPFIPTLKVGVFGVQNANTISSQLQALVRSYVDDGWEYVRLEQVSVMHTAGCLASLFGAKSHSVDYDLVVFRKPADELDHEEIVPSAQASATTESTQQQPVPNAVKCAYRQAQSEYRVWEEAVAGDDAFVDDDDLDVARRRVVASMKSVADLCRNEHPGVGRAVARKARQDFRAVVTDPEFSSVLESLESHV